MRFDQIRRPDWTDLAVVLGPNVRWVECAYEDFVRLTPEVLLGYRVRLATPTTRLEGYDIRKLVVLEPAPAFWPLVAAVHARGGRVERYDVHRPYPIHRVA